MKTSKEMQLKILDKMLENVEGGVGIFEGIQDIVTTGTLDAGSNKVIVQEVIEGDCNENK